MKLSFRMRILIPSVIIVILAFMITGIMVYRTANRAIEKVAMENMSNASYRHGNVIKSNIEMALATLNTIASAASSFTAAEAGRYDVVNFLHDVLEHNEYLLDAVIVWEPNAFDGMDDVFKDAKATGSAPNGRFAPLAERSTGKIITSYEPSIDKDAAQRKWYDTPLKSGKVYISEPVSYDFGDKKITTISMSMPVRLNNKIIGVAAVDISIDEVTTMLKELKIYETGYAFLLSNAYMVISHPIDDMVGKPFQLRSDIESSIEQNKEIMTNAKNLVDNKDAYTLYTPIKLGNVDDYKFVFGISAPKAEVLAANSRIGYEIAIVALISVICVSLLMTLLVRSLMRLLGGEPRDVLNAIHKIAQGDFTVDITSKGCESDSIAGSVQCMVDTLKNMINETIEISEELKTSSGDLSAGAQELSAGVSNQAERAGQISAASSEMAATTEDIARNLADISTFANQTAEKTINGDKVVNESLSSISQIKDTVEHSFKLVNSLGEKSKGISDIVNVISDIADQTNLLALNAAIEAARVGEAGRGFAVVADEVRKLAERTQHATSEISTLVASTLSEVDNVIQSMDGVAGKVNAGVESSKQITVVLKDIEGGVSQLQSMVENISTATQEMSATSNQVQQDIDSVASVSAQVSATSDHLAKNASSLETISLHLRTMMTRFKIIKN